ncbi:hypothetical protein PHMEG_0008116 [Phytophthora megakarya]|uniref:ZSWIM1/3 RNaseH-like domain-containing protein n=1 Tax=Phytophthora megakarya TaxID=4795 RepID=A0A225WJJ0_9STRA|nr:hypothetical protein PHMEG_0008116 [Phytophthora megakarya]
MVTAGSFRLVLVVLMQFHTHNHETKTRVAFSYLKTKSLPLEKRDPEYVALLADAKVSSKHINAFTCAAIMPQQTRNLIREIMGKASGEDCLKRMLLELVQLDRCDVLMMQEHMDVTCGIVMQTKLQKLMFAQWGQTLAMDFIHGTNNLGYHEVALRLYSNHIGSLVVTTATGRGFTVFEFLCLSQQASAVATA